MKLVSLLVASLLFVLVNCKASRLRPRRDNNNSRSSNTSSDDSSSSALPLIKARRDALNILERSLVVIFENNKLQIGSTTSFDLRSLLIKKAREEMFEAYDKFSARHCKEEKSLEGKKKAITKAWRILDAALFSLDKNNYHNGCLTVKNQFGNLVYE